LIQCAPLPGLMVLPRKPRRNARAPQFGRGSAARLRFA
jgi:hypothetical protein